MPQNKRQLLCDAAGALAVAGLSTGFYIQTTQGAAPVDVSGVAVPNALMSFLMAMISFRYERHLLEEKKYREAVLVLLAAALVCSAPTIISTHKAMSKGFPTVAIAPPATLLSNMVLSVLAIKKLRTLGKCEVVPRALAVPFWLRNARGVAGDEEKTHHKTRETVLRNLAILSERLQAVNLAKTDLTALLPAGTITPAQLLEICLLLTQSMQSINDGQPNMAGSAIKRTSQLALSAAMLTGSLGYVYATQAAMAALLGNLYLATVLGLGVMSCQLILNVNSAFMLIAAAAGVITIASKYRRLPNELTLGGQWTLLLPLILAPLLACRSGLTAQNLYDENQENATMRIAFPHLSILIYYFTCMFNGIFVGQSIHFVKNEVIENVGDSEDTKKARAFLVLDEALSALISEVKATRVGTLTAHLETLGCVALTRENLFATGTIQHVGGTAAVQVDDEHTRLLQV